MTGSTAAGNQIAQNSRIVNLHLELGGNAPVLVFADADLKAAAAACTKGALKYSGQRCSAVSRVLVHESVYEQFIDYVNSEMEKWVIGDLFDEESRLGPLINEEHAIRVEELIQDATERGAEIVQGGERNGIYIPPTLLRDVPQISQIIQEEQFGPVVPVMPFTERKEAVELANSSSLSLDAAVFTDSYDCALSIADELEAGTVRINGAPSHGLGDIPFGGNQNSGIGREGLHTSIYELLRTKSIVL